MDKSRIRILVVDDERGLCAGLQEALQREGYTVDAALDARSALRLLNEGLYNLVLTDVKMPELSGLDLLRQARQRSPDTLLILMTAYGTVESAVAALKEGAYDYLPKPLDMQRLRTVVLKALEFQALAAENHELRARLQKRSEPNLLLGHSEVIRQVTQLAAEVARSDVTVLLEGESGTGKELLARMIHTWSERARRPFISVNCAALPEQLLEAELFGHVRGAFTGAVSDKPGRFQLADGGTLFLAACRTWFNWASGAVVGAGRLGVWGSVRRGNSANHFHRLLHRSQGVMFHRRASPHAVSVGHRRFQSRAQPVKSFEVVGQADQRPFQRHFLTPSQPELPKSHHALDDPKHRFDGLLSEFVERLARAGA
jgi:DNA-binding response OmpR family regulator